MGPFRREDHLFPVAPRPQPPPDRFLADASFPRQPIGVHLRRIDEIAAELEVQIQQAERFRLRNVDAPDQRDPEADDGRLEFRPRYGSVLQGFLDSIPLLQSKLMSSCHSRMHETAFSGSVRMNEITLFFNSPNCGPRASKRSPANKFLPGKV